MLNLYYKLFNSLTNLKELELNNFLIHIPIHRFLRDRYEGFYDYLEKSENYIKKNYIHISDFDFLDNLEKLKIKNCKNFIFDCKNFNIFDIKQLEKMIKYIDEEIYELEHETYNYQTYYWKTEKEFKQLNNRIINEIKLTKISIIRFIEQYNKFISLKIFENCKNLKELEIVNNNNKDLYDFIKQFNNLETLILKNCNNILEIPNLRNLNKLNIINCKNIIEIPDTFINLKELIIDNNINIREIPNLIKLTKLELINCNINIKKNLNTFINLEELTIDNNNINEIPYSFINLKELKIYNCNNIKEIPDNFINLKKMIIHNCHNIISIPEIYKILKCSINII